MVTMADAMLTTIDNPYDPFTEWDQWFTYDVQKGYNSCGLLARFTTTSIGLSDQETDSAIEEAICKLNFLIYKKVYRKEDQN